MAQSILVFDFGANEDAAQQARHKVEAWKQGFRLGNKMVLKFEREETAAETPESAESQSPESAESVKGASKDGKKKSAAKARAKSGAKASPKVEAEPEQAEPSAASNGKVRLLVRLNFSDHEKLSHQRWLDRIPAEEPFKSANGQTIRVGDPEFAKTAELFDSLD